MKDPGLSAWHSAGNEGNARYAKEMTQSGCENFRMRKEGRVTGAGNLGVLFVPVCRERMAFGVFRSRTVKRTADGCFVDSVNQPGMAKEMTQSGCENFRMRKEGSMTGAGNLGVWRTPSQRQRL